MFRIETKDKLIGSHSTLPRHWRHGFLIHGTSFGRHECNLRSISLLGGR